MGKEKMEEKKKKIEVLLCVVFISSFCGVLFCCLDKEYRIVIFLLIFFQEMGYYSFEYYIKSIFNVVMFM